MKTPKVLTLQVAFGSEKMAIALRSFQQIHRVLNNVYFYLKDDINKKN